MTAAADEVPPGATADYIIVAPAPDEVEGSAAYEEIRPTTALENV